MKKILPFPLLSLPLLTLALSAQVLAADNSITDQVNADKPLNTVYVTRGTSVAISPTGFEQTNVDTPVSLSIITSAEIEATGASSLVDVLKTQTGIQIKDFIGDGSRSVISMRGFGANSANNVLIVVDGRKLNNPTLEAPLLSSIALKDVERIEVIQGSGGVLFGDQAVGGVINIITKKIDSDQLTASVTHGTDDLKTYNISGSKKLSNGFNYRVSLESKTADNYRDNNEANYDNVFAQLSYEARWGEIFLERSYIDDRLNTPGFISNAKINENRRQLGSAGFFDNRINVERVGAKFFLNDIFILENDFSLRDTSGDVNNFGLSSQDTRVKTYASKLLGKWNTNNGDVLLTSGYEDIKSDYQNTGFSVANWVNNQESIYSQLVYPFAPRFSIAAGVRYTKVTDDNLKKTKSLSDSATARELGINYKANNARYFFRVAEAFRFGNADENGRVLTGIDFLSPQKSTSFESGFELTSKLTRINVMYYDMDIEDEIYYDSIASANVNLENSNRKGIVVELDQGITNNIAVGTGYSFTKARYTSGNYNGNEVPGVAEQTASVYIDYKLSNTVSFYLDTAYTGERFPDSDNANTSKKLGGYTLLNFNTSWKKGGSLVNFRINNLGNKKYAGLLFSSGGYPSPERNVQITYSYSIQ
jgi:iron complex outermembrane recepter protein